MQDANGKWIQVRSLREHRRLLFRYNPVLDLIEVKVDGHLEVIALDDYRLPCCEQREVGVDFRRIDGESFDG